MSLAKSAGHLAAAPPRRGLNSIHFGYVRKCDGLEALKNWCEVIRGEVCVMGGVAGLIAYLVYVMEMSVSLRLVRQIVKKKKGTCDVVRARLDRETWTGTGRVAGFARHYQRPSAGGGPDPRGLDRRSRPLARTSFHAPPTSPSTATENRLGAIAARRTYYKNPIELHIRQPQARPVLH